VTMMASALLEEGPDHLRRVEREVVEWLETREYSSVGQLRGSVSQESTRDPAAFERANYMSVLRSYSSPRHL